MSQNFDDDQALQALIKGIAKNASKKKKRPVASSAQKKTQDVVTENKPKVKKVVKKKEGKKYIVVYQDDQGAVLQTTFVEEGKDAVAPVMPEVKEELEHHRVVFAGWDQDGKNVRKNLVIKPVYEQIPKQYLIMYFSEAGKVLGTEKVNYGEAATAYYEMEKASTPEFQYTFVGWNQDLTFIEKDMMVKPVFAPIKRKYLIRFLGDRNQVLDTQNVRYGDLPKPPSGAQKRDDPVYFYHFNGWDRQIEAVTGSTQYYAVFQPEYKEYQFKVYLEDELIQDKSYHYRDTLEYPDIQKKGYHLIWDTVLEEITQDTTVHGSWDFANKKGSIIEHEKGSFRVLNPSVHGGTVSLVSFYDNQSMVVLPDKIKLGDYYYKITQIEKNAFSACSKIRQITLGNNVEEIRDRGFGGCKGLKKVILGRNVKVFGKQLFYGTKSLSEIRIKGGKLKKISPQAFDHMNGKVKIKADNILPFQLKKLFAKGIAGGNVVI